MAIRTYVRQELIHCSRLCGRDTTECRKIINEINEHLEKIEIKDTDITAIQLYVGGCDRFELEKDE